MEIREAEERYLVRKRCAPPAATRFVGSENSLAMRRKSAVFKPKVCSFLKFVAKQILLQAEVLGGSKVACTGELTWT